MALPLGTIRLMETFSIEGAIDEDKARKLRHHVLALLHSAMPSPPGLIAPLPWPAEETRRRWCGWLRGRSPAERRQSTCDC